MLSDAGVDCAIFDVTNQLTYPRSYLALCKVWSQVRKEGGKTPQIVFLAPFGAPAQVVNTLYRDFYSKGLYNAVPSPPFHAGSSQFCIAPRCAASIFVLSIGPALPLSPSHGL